MTERFPMRSVTLAVACCLAGALAGLPYLMVRHAAPPIGVLFAATWAAAMFCLCALAMKAPPRLWIGAAAGLFLLSRAAVMVGLGSLHDVETGNDYAAYTMLAENVLNGRGLLAHTDHFGWVSGMYPPLYPLLLAGIGRFLGVNPASILILNAAIDLCCAFLIHRIGARLGEPKAGTVAALLYLFWPNLVIVAPLAQKEGLSLLLTLTLALALLRTREEGASWKAAAILGVDAGLLALTQPALATLPLFMGAAILWGEGWKSQSRLTARALPFLIVVLTPWWIRNWLLFGAFVPLTTSAGASMFIAAAGHSLADTQGLSGLPEPAMSAIGARRALSIMAADPAAFTGRRLLDLARALLLKDYNPMRLAGFTPPIAWARSIVPMTQVAYIALCGLATAALVKWRQARGLRLVSLLIAGLLAQMLLDAAFFEFGERHMQHLEPFLMLLAGMALVRILERGEGAAVETMSVIERRAAVRAHDSPH